MYSCTLNPSYTDDEFARLFNSSWDKLPDDMKGLSQADALDVQKSRVAEMNCVIGVYEDSYLLALLSGVVNDGRVVLVSAYFGADSNGSKSYIHNADWTSAVETFNKANFTDFGFTTVNSSAIDVFSKSQESLRDSLYAGTEVQTNEQEGVTYNGSNYKTS